MHYKADENSLLIYESNTPTSAPYNTFHNPDDLDVVITKYQLITVLRSLT